MATAMQSEIERKYDVDAEAAVPELVGVVAATAAEPTVRMRAVYYDTADRALSRGRITMRRRVGGEDQGWHVKLPGAKARTELHVPLTRTATVPKAVRSPVLAFVGTAPLRPIARLTTDRTIVRLLDADGRQLAELADDLVVAIDLADGTERRWREWEVELKEHAPAGDDERAELLDAVATRLAEAGAHPAISVSKLARATGRTGTERPEPAPLDTGGDVALAAITELIAQLRSADPWVRLDGDDAVHRLRVLTRRLRSVLAGSRRALDRAVTDPIRVELKWLAALLGDARDAEVARARVAALFADVPGEEQAASRLDAELSGRYSKAHRRVTVALHGKRYLALLSRLDALVGAPPLTPEAGDSARVFVGRSLKHEARRVVRAFAAAEAGDVEQRHELRKAAKRLRYVGEAWATTAPDAVRSKQSGFAALAEDAADALGDERDDGAMRELLRAGAETAHRARERTFGYGVAWAIADRRHRESRDRAESAVAALLAEID